MYVLHFLCFLLLLSMFLFPRNNCVRDWVQRIEKHDGGLKDFSQAYKYYGLHFQQDNSVIAREWAPGAVQVYLTGDFSNFCNVFPNKRLLLLKICFPF